MVDRAKLDLTAVTQRMREISAQMYSLVRELYPICRSITGNGVRETLRILGREIPLAVHEVPTGTPVFDWTVPREWNIRDAYVKNSRGERVIDFQKSNLHVLNYSVPVRKTVSLAELKQHLYSDPEHPDWVPYRTSYYKENWAFCVSHKQLQQLPEDRYEACIDSSLQDGHLTYGEYFIRGETEDEILISCHVCHPSLCNDNLSGMAVATFLAKQLMPSRLRYSYRFVFIPVTIGSITWLARNESNANRIKHGLVLSCVGDGGNFTYKRSRQGNAEVDRAVEHVLKHSDRPYRVNDFVPYGYDERQYCSPGFNLPVGCFMRTPNGCYPQYHTSADDLSLVTPEALGQSLETIFKILFVLENNRSYLNQNPKGEPQLGKRGLYSMIGGSSNAKSAELAMLWVLNLADGQHSLLDIANQSGVPFGEISAATDALVAGELLHCPRSGS